jgi:hypothetical protein
MEVLVLDGKSYVKAGKAAKDLGYATDYVGQLCRTGKITAHLIGRTWYVDPEELGNHRFEKKRMARTKAREQAKKAILEHRVKVTDTQKNYRNIDIQYDADDEALIPEVRKVKVESLPLGKLGYQEKPEYDNETTVINKGEKVLMSGRIAVTDVTDEPIETDTVLLTPGRIRSGTITVAPRIQEPQESVEVVINQGDDITTSESEENESKPLSFSEKLGKLTEETIQTEEVETPVSVYREEYGSFVPYAFFLLVILSLVLMSPALTSVSVYSDTVRDVTISYSLYIQELIYYFIN